MRRAVAGHLQHKQERGVKLKWETTLCNAAPTSSCSHEMSRLAPPQGKGTANRVESSRLAPGQSPSEPLFVLCLQAPDQPMESLLPDPDLDEEGGVESSLPLFSHQQRRYKGGRQLNAGMLIATIGLVFFLAQLYVKLWW